MLIKISIQTSFTVVIFFVLTWLIIDEFGNVIYQMRQTIFHHISKHQVESLNTTCNRCFGKWSNTTQILMYIFPIETTTKEKTGKSNLKNLC